MFVLKDFKEVLTEDTYNKFVTKHITTINANEIIMVIQKPKTWRTIFSSPVTLSIRINHNGEIIIELLHKYFSKLGLGFNLYSCPKSVIMDCAYFLDTFPFPLTHEWEFKKGFRGLYYQYWIACEKNLFYNKENSALLVYWISKFV